MKKALLFSFACVMVSLMSMAQNRFEFKISGGISNDALKVKMEQQVTNLLAMMNDAQINNKSSLNFKGVNISEDAKRYILKMWNEKHLCVWQDEEGEENYIEENCLRFGQSGYQIRNIPMREIPVKGNIDDPYTEVCINFDFQGKIVDFNIVMKNIQYTGFSKNSEAVIKESEKMMITYYMHQLEKAYLDKDMSFFENIFSENALIITGVKKFKTIKTDFKMVRKEDYDYTVKTKKEYLTSLKAIFNRNKNTDIHVKFNNIKVSKAGGENYYIAYAEQKWDSKGYEDLGNITILWDFRNPDEPQILVRVWQHLDDKKSYTFSDFPLE